MKVEWDYGCFLWPSVWWDVTSMYFTLVFSVRLLVFYSPNCNSCEHSFGSTASAEAQVPVDYQLQPSGSPLHVIKYRNFILNSALTWITQSLTLDDSVSHTRVTNTVWLMYICVKMPAYRIVSVETRLRFKTVNPLKPKLNLFAHRCLTRFFTGDFASWTVHFVNICVKNQQMQQLFIQFINYVW
jgi:hypothetical protein